MTTTEKDPTSEIVALQAVGHGGQAGAGAAAACGLLFGGAGVLAGALAGGSASVTFQLRLRDGRELLGSAAPSVFQLLQAAAYDAGVRAPGPEPAAPLV